MNIHPDVVKAYKKTLDADDKHAEHGTTITKRNATRAATQLSKKIKQHHPDLSMSDKIKLRTKLQDMNENFMDGRNPQDKGDSKRHGIPKKASISQLKKIRSSKTASPRKKQLAHWQINMRQGKKKRNEDASPATSIGNASVALPPTMRPMVAVDRRRKKDGPVVLLKRFRKHLEDG